MNKYKRVKNHAPETHKLEAGGYRVVVWHSGLWHIKIYYNGEIVDAGIESCGDLRDAKTAGKKWLNDQLEWLARDLGCRVT